MLALFIFVALCAGYSYVLYPLLLILIRSLVPTKAATKSSRERYCPTVSLIVTAHNEVRRIAEKIENCLELRYPRLDILVASDCSTDGTDDIVRRYSARGVRIVRANKRRGKEFAQKAAISEAHGDILVFSDVGTSVKPDTIKLLVEYFGDPSVGAVSSEDRFIGADGVPSGEGAYVRYEMFLRRQESSLAGLVGLSGSFFAARRAVCELWDVESPSDFNTALNCVRLGLKAVAAPNVLGYYKDLTDPSREYERKVRTVLRGMTGLARHPDVISPFKFGLFAWQVFSHKLMRWLTPVFLVAVLGISAALYWQNWFFQLLLGLQVLFYATAVLGHFVQRMRSLAVVRLAYFFCQANVAICHAGWKFATGHRTTTWQPSVR